MEDGSTICVSAVLKTICWGCGGSASQASFKLTVRSSLLSGGLAGPYLQAGRAHESGSPFQQQAMPKGSLWIADLGSFALKGLLILAKQGIYFLLRDIAGVLVCNEHGQLMDLLTDLPQEPTNCATSC